MGSEWYVARDGDTFGPFSFERMLQGVRDGEMKESDRVWCAGMPDWLPAAEVPEFRLGLRPTPPPGVPAVGEADVLQAGAAEPRLQVPAGSEGAKGARDAARRRAGLVSRHWRGELTLAQSYWGAGFLLTLLTVGLSKPFGAWLEQLNLSPAPLGIVLSTYLIFLCAFVAWQLVGIWRSAGRHIRSTGRRTWAVLARIAVVVGAIRAVADFSSVIGPMLQEAAVLATGRESIPAHRLRLLRNGTELELAGGMPFGTAEALAKLLDGAPGVKVLHLNSIGGRVSEGFQIFQLVRDRRLVTYTATDCASACTMAFLGGDQRYLSTKARLGFHSVSFGSVDHNQLPSINADLRRMLAEQGAPSWFVDRALSTDASSMWYPSHIDLIAAKIVTRVVDPDDFGWSGIEEWSNTEALTRGLLSIPLYRLIRDDDPEGFKRIADRFSEAIKRGKPMPQVIQEVQATAFAEIVPRYLQVAPDGVVQRYWRTQIAEMEHLRRTSPDACIAYAFPELRRDDYNLNTLLPVELLADDSAALTDLVQQAVRAPDRRKSDSLERDLDEVVARIASRIPAAPEVLAEPARYFKSPALLCDVTVAFYTEILALPADRSGRVLRALVEPTK